MLFRQVPRDDQRRGPPRRGLAGHGVQGAQWARSPVARHHRAHPAGRRAARLPAERASPRPADRSELHRRADHHGQLRPLQHPGGAGGRGRPRPGPDLGIPLRQPGRSDPGAALPAHPARTAGRRHHRHRPPPGPQGADRQRHPGPRRLRDDLLDRPQGPLPRPRRRRRRRDRSAPPAQHRADQDRPRDRPALVRWPPSYAAQGPRQTLAAASLELCHGRPAVRRVDRGMGPPGDRRPAPGGARPGRGLLR